MKSLLTVGVVFLLLAGAEARAASLGRTVIAASARAGICAPFGGRGGGVGVNVGVRGGGGGGFRRFGGGRGGEFGFGGRFGGGFSRGGFGFGFGGVPFGFGDFRSFGGFGGFGFDRVIDREVIFEEELVPVRVPVGEIVQTERFVPIIEEQFVPFASSFGGCSSCGSSFGVSGRGGRFGGGFGFGFGGGGRRFR